MKFLKNNFIKNKAAMGVKGNKIPMVKLGKESKQIHNYSRRF